MEFWRWLRLVWWRALMDAQRMAIPHTAGSTVRLGVILLLTTLAMYVADQRLHIVTLGLMSADNLKDNLFTLGIFVPIGLLSLFALWFFAEGLFLVPFKMWREQRDTAVTLTAEKAQRDTIPKPDWPIYELAAAALKAMPETDDPFDALEAIRDKCSLGAMEIWGRRGSKVDYGEYLGTGAMERIQVEYWRDHEFDVPTCASANHPWEARTKPTHSSSSLSYVEPIVTPLIYMDLKVSRIQALSIWPASGNDSDA